MDLSRRTLLAAAAVTQVAAHRVDEGQATNRLPVRAVAAARLPVGGGQLPLTLSRDWDRPSPAVDRAVIVIHGRLRDADVYYRAAEKAAAAAGAAADGTLLIVPQFLAGIDVRDHSLPPATLHWSLTGWMGGDPAEAPAPVSSFDALDAVLARLGDRAAFPGLRTVVVAGHSGGGQVVQRYAVLGRGGDRLQANGIAVRYVVANPSSYVYFSPDRPAAGGGFAPFDAASCPDFDDWKYGLRGLPPYAGHQDATSLEAAYVGRRVSYLLGGDDTDPAQRALDKSCPAEAQGPHRLARGRAYYAYLRLRHPGLTHRLEVVPGVGHDGEAMFGSPPGLRALFED